MYEEQSAFGVIHKGKVPLPLKKLPAPTGPRFDLPAPLPPTPKPLSGRQKANNAVKRKLGSKTVPPRPPKNPNPPTASPANTPLKNLPAPTGQRYNLPAPASSKLPMPKPPPTGAFATGQPKAPASVKQAVTDKKKSGATDWIKNNKLKTTGITAGAAGAGGGAYYYGKNKNRG